MSPFLYLGHSSTAMSPIFNPWYGVVVSAYTYQGTGS